MLRTPNFSRGVPGPAGPYVWRDEMPTLLQYIFKAFVCCLSISLPRPPLSHCPMPKPSRLSPQHHNSLLLPSDSLLTVALGERELIAVGKRRNLQERLDKARESHTAKAVRKKMPAFARNGPEPVLPSAPVAPEKPQRVTLDEVGEHEVKVRCSTAVRVGHLSCVWQSVAVALDRRKCFSYIVAMLLSRVGPLHSLACNITASQRSGFAAVGAVYIYRVGDAERYFGSDCSRATFS